MVHRHYSCFLLSTEVVKNKTFFSQYLVGLHKYRLAIWRGMESDGCLKGGNLRTHSTMLININGTLLHCIFHVRGVTYHHLLNSGLFSEENLPWTSQPITTVTVHHGSRGAALKGIGLLTLQFLSLHIMPAYF